MEPWFFGVDPGVSGGVAVLDTLGQVVHAGGLPSDPTELVQVFQALARPARRPWVVGIESVHASPQMGVVSAFTFGRAVGRVETAVVAARPVAQAPSVLTVTPQTWQKWHGCRTGGDKNISKLKAQALFPDLKITHAIADALLIAMYVRQLVLEDV